MGGFGWGGWHGQVVVHLSWVRKMVGCVRFRVLATCELCFIIRVRDWRAGELRDLGVAMTYTRCRKPRLARDKLCHCEEERSFVLSFYSFSSSLNPPPNKPMTVLSARALLASMSKPSASSLTPFNLANIASSSSPSSSPSSLPAAAG